MTAYHQATAEDNAAADRAYEAAIEFLAERGRYRRALRRFPSGSLTHQLAMAARDLAEAGMPRIPQPRKAPR